MVFKTIIIVFQLFILTLFVGCSEKNEFSVHKIPDLSNKTGTEVTCDSFDSNRQPLFGDLHIHTNFSHDSAANAIGTTPYDANRYAHEHID